MAGTWQGFIRHDGPVMAGHLAFLSLLAMFPFFIFLTALAGQIGQSEQGVEAVNQLLETLPPDVASVLSKPIAQVVKGASGSVLTFGAIIAIWTAASGMEAARTAVRRAYSRRSQRPVWSRRLESMGLIILVATLLLIGMFIQILGPAIWDGVTRALEVPSIFEELWELLRFGLSPLALFMALYGLYFFLSPKRIRPRKYRAPGALLALALWVVTATGLSTYLKYFGNYDVTYGSLAGVMITMLFLFITGMGFVLGAELNAALTRFARITPSQENKEDQTSG